VGETVVFCGNSTLDNLHSASEAVRQISEHPWKLLTGQGKKEDRNGEGN